MCGISCVVSLREKNCRPGSSSNDDLRQDTRATLESEIASSLEYIKHRGPDASGIRVSDDGQVALGHCRLAINDLRPTASQPLHSPDNTIHAVVNGEIYDFDRLREDLSPHYNFQTLSDSELVVALYQQYGMPDCLKYISGEFSFCIYDESRRRFFAVRDRYGIKPLFWTVSNGRLMVTAEIKALLGLGWEAEWDVRSIIEGGWNFDERTLFKDVRKLKPGYYLKCDVDSGEIKTNSYWDVEYPDKSRPESRMEQDMIVGVREHMLNAIRLRLRADVPIGIYLSGGIDSSALAGMASHLVRTEGLQMGSNDPNQRICCFSIAFDENSGYDESTIAERTAGWLDVKYVKKHMDEEMLSACFEGATWHCEQPHSDLNYVAKYALSEVVRENDYKVVLTGEGADENFAGYPVFLPDFLRAKDDTWPANDMEDDVRMKKCEDADTEVAQHYEQQGGSGANREPDDTSRSVGGISTVASMCAFQFDGFAKWTQSLNSRPPRRTIVESIDESVRHKMRTSWHPLHSALYTFSKGHLANSFLACLGDRTEMAHSVEARPAFLDHKLTEFVNSLPPSSKIRYKAGSDEFIEKWILREAAKPFITDELYRRKKHPYSAPPTYPKGGPMHRLLQRFCSDENVRKLGFVDCDQARNMLQRAFEVGDEKAMRSCFIIAQFVVLAKRFNVKTASLE